MGSLAAILVIAGPVLLAGLNWVVSDEEPNRSATKIRTTSEGFNAPYGEGQDHDASSADHDLIVVRPDVVTQELDLPRLRELFRARRFREISAVVTLGMQEGTPGFLMLYSDLQDACHGVPEDREELATWEYRAADLGRGGTAVMRELVTACEAVPRHDLETRSGNFRRAHELGDPDAALLLAKVEIPGSELHSYWVRVAVAQGYGEAAYLKADALRSSGTKDDTEVLAWYLVGSRLGHVGSQVMATAMSTSLSNHVRAAAERRATEVVEEHQNLTDGQG